jgi:hypothetical protein
MVISKAAFSSTKAPKTLKIRGSIQNLEFLVLINFSSSHSFISAQVTSLLQGVTPIASPIIVQVANGNVIQASSKILQVEWSLQGYSFHFDLKVLPLYSFDMILGMECLERFSPIKIH